MVSLDGLCPSGGFKLFGGSSLFLQEVNHQCHSFRAPVRQAAIKLVASGGDGEVRAKFEIFVEKGLHETAPALGSRGGVLNHNGGTAGRRRGAGASTRNDSKCDGKQLPIL